MSEDADKCQIWIPNLDSSLTLLFLIVGLFIAFRVGDCKIKHGLESLNLSSMRSYIN